MKSVRKMMLVPYEEGLDKPKNKGLKKELIISAMPKSLKRKADSLLSYIQGSIEWKNNGEVVYNDKCLEGSHNTDLVRYSLQEYSESPPPHYGTFLEILSEVNVPKSVVTHRKKTFPRQNKKTVSTWQEWVKD